MSSSSGSRSSKGSRSRSSSSKKSNATSRSVTATATSSNITSTNTRYNTTNEVGLKGVPLYSVSNQYSVQTRCVTEYSKETWSTQINASQTGPERLPTTLTTQRITSKEVSTMVTSNSSLKTFQMAPNPECRVNNVFYSPAVGRSNTTFAISTAKSVSSSTTLNKRDEPIISQTRPEMKSIKYNLPDNHLLRSNTLSTIPLTIVPKPATQTLMTASPSKNTSCVTKANDSQIRCQKTNFTFIKPITIDLTKPDGPNDVDKPNSTTYLPKVGEKQAQTKAAPSKKKSAATPAKNTLNSGQKKIPITPLQATTKAAPLKRKSAATPAKNTLNSGKKTIPITPLQAIMKAAPSKRKSAVTPAKNTLNSGQEKIPITPLQAIMKAAPSKRKSAVAPVKNTLNSGQEKIPITPLQTIPKVAVSKRKSTLTSAKNTLTSGQEKIPITPIQAIMKAVASKRKSAVTPAKDFLNSGQEKIPITPLKAKTKAAPSKPKSAEPPPKITLNSGQEKIPETPLPAKTKAAPSKPKSAGPPAKVILKFGQEKIPITLSQAKKLRYLKRLVALDKAKTKSSLPFDKSKLKNVSVNRITRKANGTKRRKVIYPGCSLVPSIKVDGKEPLFIYKDGAAAINKKIQISKPSKLIIRKTLLPKVVLKKVHCRPVEPEEKEEETPFILPRYSPPRYDFKYNIIRKNKGIHEDDTPELETEHICEDIIEYTGEFDKFARAEERKLKRAAWFSDPGVQNTTNIQPDVNNTQSDLNNTQPDLNNTQQDLNNTQPDSNNTQPDSNNTQPDLNNTQQDLNNTQQDLYNTQQDLNNTQQDLYNTQQDLNNTQQDLNNTQQDLNNTQPDVHNIQPDVYNIQPDVYNIQPDVYNIQPDVYTIQPDVHNIQPDVSTTQVGLFGVQIIPESLVNMHMVPNDSITLLCHNNLNEVSATNAFLTFHSTMNACNSSSTATTNVTQITTTPIVSSFVKETLASTSAELHSFVPPSPIPFQFKEPEPCTSQEMLRQLRSSRKSKSKSKSKSKDKAKESPTSKSNESSASDTSEETTPLSTDPEGDPPLPPEVGTRIISLSQIGVDPYEISPLPRSMQISNTTPIFQPIVTSTSNKPEASTGTSATATATTPSAPNYDDEFYDFGFDIRNIMHAFGDSEYPNPDSVKMMEVIVREELNGFVYLCELAALSTKATTLHFREAIFTLRREKQRVGRLFRYFRSREKHKIPNKPSTTPKAKKRAETYGAELREIAEEIDETGEYIRLFEHGPESTLTDCELRADRIIQRLCMPKFLMFSKARSVSFAKRMPRLAEWVVDNIHSRVPLSLAFVDILGFLTYEIVAELMNMALLVRSERISINSYERVVDNRGLNPDTCMSDPAFYKKRCFGLQSVSEILVQAGELHAMRLNRIKNKSRSFTEERYKQVLPIDVREGYLRFANEQFVEPSLSYKCQASKLANRTQRWPRKIDINTKEGVPENLVNNQDDDLQIDLQT